MPVPNGFGDSYDLLRQPFRCFGACLVWLVVVTFLLLPSAHASAGALERFLPKVSPGELLVGADAFGPAVDDIPAVPILKNGELQGYAFVNSDFVDAAGYSGKPIHIVVALDLAAKIAGVKLVDHKEPIVLVGIPESKIVKVIDGYSGFDLVAFEANSGADHKVDIVSGATVTIMVIDDSILRASLKVSRHLGLGGMEPEAGIARGPRFEIDETVTETASWETLLGEGAVRRLRISLDDINKAFEDAGETEAAKRPENGNPQSDYIDLYAAVVTIPSIGRSLLGDAEYENMQAVLAEGQQAILIAAKGRYSFKGSGYVRGGVFDRFQIIQGDESYRFRDRNHKRLGEVLAQGAPNFTEVDLFYIPAERDFDPAGEWRLELLALRAIGPTQKAFLTFDLGYKPPQRYLRQTEKAPAATVTEVTDSRDVTLGSIFQPGAEPLWVKLWRDKIPEILITTLALSALTLIFFVQDWLAKRPVLTDRIRIGFLLFTLFGLGFYANAQLSVVNVMTFFSALVSDFRWDYFLKDPLIFVLWFSVAASLLFWGRGPFCGWLCPFGAFQELLNNLAKALKIPQFEVPWWLHERLWALKYMIFLLLFGLSLYSLALAEQLAEVEPFKTAIILKFQRSWPFVLFAVAILVIGLFVERFYCRYVCPLGAALGIPGRVRMFDWLKRYRECGHPCQRCGKECMVGAIHPEGNINPNECLSCLHCQTLYYDDRRCPVMIQRRLKRERREALASKNPPPGKNKGKKPELELADFLPE
jgi:NosR/NirI family nitrous oxide reductase transcriptional regulator